MAEGVIGVTVTGGVRIRSKLRRTRGWHPIDGPNGAESVLLNCIDRAGALVCIVETCLLYVT